MSNARGAGFGLDAELAKKMSLKYSKDEETSTIRWIETVTGEKFTHASFAENLKDGTKLCNLINQIKPNSVSKVQATTMPFKQRENITAFLRACRAVGVADFDVFETADLYDEKDMGSVIRCLNALSRTAQKVPTFNGPYLDLSTTAAPPSNVTHAPSTSGLRSATLPPPVNKAPSQSATITSPSPSCLKPSATPASTSKASPAAKPPPPPPPPQSRPPPPPGRSNSPPPPSLASAVPASTQPLGERRTSATAEIMAEAWASVGSAPDPPNNKRGAGFGLDAELARKQDEKYDRNAEKQVIVWIEAVTGERFSSGFAASLKDGTLLCKLINRIKPGSIPKIATSNMPFKQMENISCFLRACRAIGMADFDAFETLDLYEEKDLGCVLRCLIALDRVSRKISTFRGPHLEVNYAAPSAAEIIAAPASSGLNRAPSARP